VLVVVRVETLHTRVALVVRRVLRVPMRQVTLTILGARVGQTAVQALADKKTAVPIAARVAAVAVA